MDCVNKGAELGMTTNKFDSKIEYISGDSPILLIAPHGHPKNDTNTGKLTRQLAQRLKCYAVINEHYRRPYTDQKTKKRYGTNKAAGRANFNDTDNIKKAGMEKSFLLPLFELKNKIKESSESGNVYVAILHGKEDDSKELIQTTENKPFILIGCGKGEIPRLSTTDINLVNLLATSLRESLTGKNTITIEDGGEYSGWDRRNLNQLFTGVYKPSEKDDQVHSVQLEIKYTGFRDTNHLDKTAEIIEAAIRSMAQLSAEIDPELLTDETSKNKAVVDNAKVEKAVDFILGSYQVALQSTLEKMLAVGKYLVENFFDDYKSASDPYAVTGDKSIRQIHEKLKDVIGAPSKTWVYDALKLTVDYHMLEEWDSFQAYGKLSTSHKVKLAYVYNIEEKKELALLSNEEKWPVRRLSTEIMARKAAKQSQYEKLASLVSLKGEEDFLAAIKDKSFVRSLKQLSDEEQAKIRSKAEKRVQKLAEEIERLEMLKINYHKIL